MQYLRVKDKKAVLQVCIPFLMAIVINVIIFNISSALFNSLYILFTLILCNKLENEEINYEVYKYRVKRSICTLIILGAVLSLINKGFAENILRFYLIYLISATILLREARKVISRNNDKKSIFVNLAITFSVVLLSMDKVYNFLIMIFSYAWLGINKIVLGVAYILMYTIGMPIYFIIKLIFAQSKNQEYVEKVVGEFTEKPIIEKVSKQIEQNHSSNGFDFMIILKVIIIIFIMYLVFKVFNKYVKRSSTDDGEVQKEKIHREKKKKKESNLSIFMKKFKGEMDFKAQILNVYLKFEQKMSDKEIYKPHMTANQLSSAAKPIVNNDKDINSITSIYNEAKFSNHEISEENAKTAKLNFGNIKKTL